MGVMVYAKAIIATLTALGTWGATAFADNGLTTLEAFGLCGVVVAGLTVYAYPNGAPEGDHFADDED
jgi:hypothetical protein